MVSVGDGLSSLQVLTLGSSKVGGNGINISVKQGLGA